MFRSGRKARRAGDARLEWWVLLVLPSVALLSAVALYSLRQDRASIEEDARRTASVLAPDLARRWGSEAGTELAALIASACSGSGLEARSSPGSTSDAGPAPLCGLVVNDRIQVPPDYPPLPSPPGWLGNLTSDEARRWRQLADLSFGADLAALRRAVALFANAAPAVRVNAEWCLLRAEARREAGADTARRLIEFAARSEGVLAESGTPLSDLARLVALRHLPGTGLPDSLLAALKRGIIDRPSFLTPTLVEELVRLAPGNPAVARLEARWMANERALALLRRLGPPAGQPSMEWVGTGPDAWLALVHPLETGGAGGRTPPGSAHHVTLLPAPLIERVFGSAGDDDAVPAYAAVTILLGGRALYPGGQRRASDLASRLASAAGEITLPLAMPADAASTFAGGLLRIAPYSIPLRQETPGDVVRLRGVPGAHAFTVSLDVIAPDRLYASYRLRLWMAVGLVLTATLAVLGGLAGAWRAFERQRRLGEMQSNFVASVSHELRAPIAAMTLMSESLERGTVGDRGRQQDYFRAIGQECRRLSGLIENVLDFSRIDRGRRPYTFAPADLRELVAKTIDLMRAYAEKRQVGLVAWRDPAGADPVPWPVDREALQQALLNLVDNAIKHSPAGAEVTVGLETSASSVRLFVHDKGPGIPAEEQARIFEPFYRRGSELRRETRGIGIGLSITKHIVEGHGGRVVVQSRPGSGSRFVIELPVPMEPAS